MNTSNSLQQDPNIKNINLNINAKEYDNSHRNSKVRPSQSNQQMPSSNKNKIIDVYEDNFIKEIKRIAKFLPNYPFIGMDTEFPGVVYPCPTYSPDFYYKYTKANVDKLKLIQIGISLFNKKGERPSYAATWQFNLKFDYKKDKIAPDAMNLLTTSGIDFEKFRTKGISYDLFAEYFTVSGLLLNDNITWISFNGFSDFAYLLNIATNKLMPETEEEFDNDLGLYFPNVYDIKIVNNNELFKGGLNKIANELNIERHGEMHQAGSDAMVTGEVFFTLLKNNYVTKEDLVTSKNILFGVGLGADNSETITYTQFSIEPDSRTAWMMIHGNDGKNRGWLSSKNSSSQNYLNGTNSAGNVNGTAGMMVQGSSAFN